LLTTRQNRPGAQGRQFAQPALGADADFGGIDLHLPVLCLAGLGVDGPLIGCR
jgi:hypothetical protein